MSDLNSSENRVRPEPEFRFRLAGTGTDSENSGSGYTNRNWYAHSGHSQDNPEKEFINNKGENQMFKIKDTSYFLIFIEDK